MFLKELSYRPETKSFGAFLNPSLITHKGELGKKLTLGFNENIIKYNRIKFLSMNNINKQIDYWKKSADRNWKTTQGLLRLKHYDACLFFCHLTLEKILKGLVVKHTNKPAPYIHDLANLAAAANLTLSKEQIDNLRIITTFNISSRYDDEKFTFYKSCTKEYTEKYFNISKKLYLWLKKQFQKK